MRKKNLIIKLVLGSKIRSLSSRSFYQMRLIILLFSTECISQNSPEIAWDKAFGEGSYSDLCYSVQQTVDNGFILAGSTDAPSPEGSSRSDNFWLVKTDSNGNKEWDKIFGGRFTDICYSVRQTSDRGYILAGYTDDAQWDQNSNSRFWIIKTDSVGNKIWDRTFGGSGTQVAYSVQQTSDEGYIIAGITNSIGSGGTDIWLIKTNQLGDKEWEKTFGGTEEDWCFSVQQSSDKGFILAGNTGSFGPATGFWLIKTDLIGNKEWDRIFVGDGSASARSVQQTSDKGYIIAGTVIPNRQREAIWLIKTDSNGMKVWDEIFQGDSFKASFEIEQVGCVQQTFDKGYILTGTGMATDTFYDAWLLKTDVFGKKEWRLLLESARADCGYSAQQTSDRGYVFAGFREPAKIINDYDYWNFWLIKFKPDEKVLIETEENLFVRHLLLQNYPNPFNSSTTISFELSRTSFVTLRILNTRGQEIEKIISQKLYPGIHKYIWRAAKLPSGLYFYQLITEEYSQTKRMLLLQ